MSDSYISYKQPQPQPVKSSMPPIIQRSIQRNNNTQLNQRTGNKGPLGFAGGGAIAAIVVGIIAIALAGTALHEASDHGEDDHRFSSLIVGNGNTISGNSNFSMIGGGSGNSITQDSDNTFIGGGSNNSIQVNSDNSGIFSGSQNIIEKDTSNSIIAGGESNNVSASRSAIVGGYKNTVSAIDSATLGGENNTVSALRSVALGGLRNTVSAQDSVVLGGFGNICSSEVSVILGGENHKISSGSEYVGILGGAGLSAFGAPRFYNMGMTGQYNSDGVSEINAAQLTGTPTQFQFMVGGGASFGERTNAFTVDNFGNLYFGTSPGACIFVRNDSYGFDAKAFTIQHPLEEEKWLVHGCLEGPEAGVYYRGKDVAPTTVKLPEYATKIADNFTVQVTPIGQPRLMSSTEIDEDGFFDVMGDGKFHWHVTGRRLEIDPEPHKDDIIINRWGPYTWNQKI